MPPESRPSTPRRPRRVDLHIPATTFIRLFAAAAIVFILLKLIPLITLLILATLFAVTLHPAVEWMRARGLPRWLALLSVASTVVGLIALFTFIVIPSLIDQMSGIGRNLGRLQNEIISRTPSGKPRELISQLLRNPQILLGNFPEYLTRVGAGVLGGVTSVGFLLILSFYLLIDGGKAYSWLATYFRPETQAKLRSTANEISPIIFAYVSGQLITSGLVTVFVFAAMSLLDVPGALLLAVIAGIFDVLPVIGFIISTLAAVLLALTVSGSTALLVVALYTGYQAFENYVIVPKVYGNRMRLSALVVLLSFTAAAPLGGIPGMLLALPIVASYPVIEKIWLRRRLGDEVVDKHQDQLKAS